LTNGRAIHHFSFRIYCSTLKETMNKEEIQTRLLRYLDQMESLISQGVELGKDEVPQFISELLQWVFWSNCLNIVGFAIILAGVVVLIRFSHRYNLDQSSDDVPPKGVVLLLVYVVSVAVSIPVVINGILPSVQKVVKVQVAPRLVIVDELKSLVK
jgi:hypothetical protein